MSSSAFTWPSYTRPTARLPRPMCCSTCSSGSVAAGACRPAPPSAGGQRRREQARPRAASQIPGWESRLPRRLRRPGQTGAGPAGRRRLRPARGSQGPGIRPLPQNQPGRQPVEGLMTGKWGKSADMYSGKRRKGILAILHKRPSVFGSLRSCRLATGAGNNSVTWCGRTAAEAGPYLCGGNSALLFLQKHLLCRLVPFAPRCFPCTTKTGWPRWCRCCASTA